MKKKSLYMAILILAPFLIASILNYAFMYLNSPNAPDLLGLSHLVIMVLKSVVFVLVGFFLVLIYKITADLEPKYMLACCSIALILMLGFSICQLAGSPFWPAYISLGFYWNYEYILPIFAGGYLFLLIYSIYKLTKTSHE